MNLKPVLCKRSVTYQGVRLLAGDQPYDTFIHFQITKMHLLLYIHSIKGFHSLQHATLKSDSLHHHHHFMHNFIHNLTLTRENKMSTVSCIINFN